MASPIINAARSVQSKFAPPEHKSEACLNCATPLIGPFCSACGQRDIPPYPNVRELVVDAFWELSGWDGRFLRTVRDLFRHPGRLTREFLEGRRASYLSPLRLYLLASLVYFLAAAARTSAVGDIRINASSPADTMTAAGRVAATLGGTVSTGVGLDSAAYAKSMRDIAKAPAILRPLFRRLVVDPKGFKKGLTDAMPRLLFALVPVFAVIVGLFYRGRKYPEHLYFAIHLHAFVFLALLLNVGAAFTKVKGLSGVGGMIAFWWIIIYSNIAFRRVYGGGIARTLLKQIGIGILYMCSAILALVVTVYVVALVA